MPDVPVAGPDDDGYHHAMEERVSGVEADIRDMKSSMQDMREIMVRMETKLDATLPHLATKAEVGELRAEIVATNARTAEINTSLSAGIAATNARISEVNATLSAAINATNTSLTAAIEATNRSLSAAISKTQATLAGEIVATNARITELRADMVTGLAEKPSKTYMWGVLAVLLTAYACGLAGLAILK